MNIDKTIEYLSMVNNVVPDYSDGRNKGLTDDDTERFTMQAIVNAITFLEKYRTSMALNVELDEMVDVLNQRIMNQQKIIKHYEKELKNWLGYIKVLHEDLAKLDTSKLRDGGESLEELINMMGNEGE